MQRIEHRASFGGWQDVYRHSSQVLACEMTFAVYLPPQAATRRLPVLYWLSGLTCTEQNFITKAGAQRYAAEHGLILVAPDTSPRARRWPMPKAMTWARARASTSTPPNPLGGALPHVRLRPGRTAGAD